jgi:RPA family protein
LGDIRLKVLTQAQEVIRRYWMLYKNNKNHFKQARAANNAQSLLKNLVEQKKRENAG